jgi:NADP-dependent alcohol dehydrogenase
MKPRQESSKTVVFHTMGMDTKLSDYTKTMTIPLIFIVNRFDEKGWKGLGEKQNITLDKVKSIVEEYELLG